MVISRPAGARSGDHTQLVVPGVTAAGARYVMQSFDAVTEVDRIGNAIHTPITQKRRKL